MSDRRRHSVDVPLSRTLVALKRVRSLRDPATNSMSKSPAFIDNMNWEMNSCNGAFLELSNSYNHTLIHTQNYHLEGRREDVGSNSESDYSSRIPNPKITSSNKTSMIHIGGSDFTKTKQIHESYRDGTRKSLVSTRVPQSTNILEDEVDSYSAPNFEVDERDNAFKKKSRYGKHRNPFPVVDVAMSRVGSPCMSMCESRTNGSSRSTLGLMNEEVDIVDSNHNGCGISCCWSRTPKYRDSNLRSDIEDQDRPLLSAEGRETAYREFASYPESPRSFSQKFRPRSFDELVGQNVVAQSLLTAISKGKIAPMYLFHGPRGTGKTSTARIFSAALNCLSLEEHRPCGFCRECLFLFSGRSRDVKELDAAKTNHKDRVKSLLKSASRVPTSARFKVFIIDECQFLLGETWAAVLNSLEELSRHAVFVMITSDLDKLPHSSASRCQRYHFPKIKDGDSVCRLQKICIEEGLDFDKDALDFIAAKSNGSLRDAETMLDQLGLLGKRITVSLAYELIGVVSDDELVDLLDLALSSDTSNTVRRARELMTSRVDPMQLISQLANLIMDILAGRCQSGSSEVGRNFFRRHALAEIGLQKLRHALKILSETEKQLRTSKNQATWLTVALLQFSTGESSLVDVNGSKASPRTAYLRDDGRLSTTSPMKSLINCVCHACNNDKSNCSDRLCDRIRKLETIWRRTIENCQSNSLKSFLQKEGSLSSIYVNEGLAIAEVGFCHLDHVSKAEKSWKLIASSLQHVLGCNVEIRINLLPSPINKIAKVKKPSFSILSCSGRKQAVSDSTMTDGNETETSARRETIGQAYPSDHEKQLSSTIQNLDVKPIHNASCFHDKEAVTIRNIEGNALSTGNTTSNRSLQDDLPKGCKLETDFPKEVGVEGQHIKIQEPDYQPSCFAKTLKLQRRFLSADAAHTICLRIQPHNKLELSIPKKASFETYFCTKDPYIFCSRSNSHVTYSSGEENVPSRESRFNSKLHCWRAPSSSIRKAWQQRQHQ